MAPPPLGAATALSRLRGILLAHIAMTRIMKAFERLQSREGLEDVRPVPF